MKVFMILACALAVANANAIGHGGYGGHQTVIAAPLVAHAKLVNTGHSEQTRKQDAAGNYAFSYNEQHGDGGSSRKEQGDGWGNKAGSYSLNVADGRQRVVKYVADAHGFRAAISTNEPGTAAKPAAATSISSPYHAPIAPEPIAHAPIAYAAAPVAIAEPIAAYGGHGDAGYGAGYGAGLGYAGGLGGLGGHGAGYAGGYGGYGAGLDGGCAGGLCGGKGVVAHAPMNFGYSTNVEHASMSKGYGGHY